MGLVVWLLLLAPADPVAPAFDPSHAYLAHASDRWLVWIKHAGIPGEEGAQAPRFRTRYLLQRVGDPATTTVLDYVTHFDLKLGTVLADGTLLLYYGTSLYWVPRGDKPLSERPHPVLLMDPAGRQYNVVRADEDGLFLQPHDLNTNRPVDWVPFDGRELAWERRVCVTDEEGVSVNRPPPFLRWRDLVCHGDVVVDLRTGRRTAAGANVVNWARAFDGRYLADFGQIISLDDGHTVKLPYWHQVFAFHDEIGYGIRPSSGPEPTILFASDPRTGRVVNLLQWNTPDIHASWHDVDEHDVILYRRRDTTYCLVWTRHGIHVWDGAQWRHVPWLESLPEED